MSKTYELRVHSRDVRYNLSPFEGDTYLGQHTGYDLITTHEDGTQTIQYIDLTTDFLLSRIDFFISEPIIAENYTITDQNGNSRMLLWGVETSDNGAIINTTEDYLNNKQVYTSIVESDSKKALTAFNKIRLEATMLSQLSSKLEYKLYMRNCNTSTAYFSKQYLNGANVFLGLMQQTHGEYTGSGHSFYNQNSTDTTDVTIKAVREILDKYYSLVGSNEDLTNVNCEVINQADSWYTKFTTEDYNYIFVGGESCNIENGNNDSIIYLGNGHNVLNSGSGNNIVYGGENIDSITLGDGANLVYGGNGQNYIHTGTGNDIIYGGMGRDNVDGGAGDNTVYLGAGGDTYTGGDGVDIVDGGSVNKTITDSKDTSYQYEITEDLSGDINTIRLRGGNDKYTGGQGKDHVWSGSGDDEINTGAGDDVVYTTDGEATDTNTVNLGSGNDEFHGGAGKDVVNSGSGSNIIHTGAGRDEVNTTAANEEDLNKVYLGAGGDTFEGGKGRDIVDGGVADSGEYDINEVRLGGGNDEYYGGAGIDKVHGGNGDDYISGGDNNDVLHGDYGNDIIANDNDVCEIKKSA